ncbi:DNA cytosine methyltransferase [Rhodococcus sp. IEGM 1406]|uniref:DNA cytosine methyltransferase n=1 Tax=Rhodococcus sp. IEGM 1406 TaxID=3047083 RepID=UPI0024B68196|nr:DNA cytosine methyltransferase [Rhodococcus sp. IEGM 1406]MDI9909614.1 DNA cytosine methyltransferase [Rhodococcus sp. IEGM 1406]
MRRGNDDRFSVVDLFSGGGGMSFGFHSHPAFEVVGAADAQLGKPSSARGSLACNSTYQLNMGIEPVAVDLSSVSPRDLKRALRVETVDVLSACPPCTGFTRTNSNNHLVDDARNSLVPRVALYAKALKPSVIVMENARELLTGNFLSHFKSLERDLVNLGYTLSNGVHTLTTFGLPQIRERALIVATRSDVESKTLEDLWDGYRVSPDALTVRRAISHLSSLEPGEVDRNDPSHVAPRFATQLNRARIAAIPHDGGSWRDLLDGGRKTAKFLTPAMMKLVERGKLGSFPDVYGRMAWDKPAPTIKRESGHVGNGRYAHPVDDRLCSLRELAILNGFPADYKFGGSSLANKYRHVGDAVPPLISYQIASAVAWSLTGDRPAITEIILPGTSLRAADILPVNANEMAA